MLINHNEGNGEGLIAADRRSLHLYLSIRMPAPKMTINLPLRVGATTASFNSLGSGLGHKISLLEARLAPCVRRNFAPALPSLCSIIFGSGGGAPPYWKGWGKRAEIFPCAEGAGFSLLQSPSPSLRDLRSVIPRRLCQRSTSVPINDMS